MKIDHEAPIQKQVYFGFGLIIFIFSILGIVSFFVIHSLGSLTATIYNHPLKVSNAALTAQASTVRMYSCMKDVLLEDNSTSLEKLITCVLKEEKEILNNLNIIRDFILGVEGENIEIKTRNIFLSWKPVREQIVHLVKSGEKEKAAQIAKEMGAEQEFLIEQQMLLLTSYARNKADGFIKQSIRVQKKFTLMTGIIIVIGALFSVFIAYYTSRQVKETCSHRIIAEDELLAVSQLNESIVTEAPVGIVIYNSSGNCVAVNESAAQLIGATRDECLQQNFHQLDSWKKSGLYKAVLDSTKENRKKNLEIHVVSSFGKECDFKIHIVPLSKNDEHHVMILFEDIADRKLAQEKVKKYSEKLEAEVANRTKELEELHQQLIQKEKLAAIGQLAGSVAHDIRNPLGAIGHSIYFLNLINHDQTHDKVKKHLDIMDREISRANDIITDLMDYSRNNTPVFVEGDLNNFINRQLQDFNIPDSIQCEINLAANLPLLQFDYLQLERVFYNLILNAIQAMPNGGNLRVSTATVEESINIQIQDTGTGIAPDATEKIFDPLFTTKTRGVGLGLSIVKTFIEKHNGRIEVESKLDKGTSFYITLPSGLNAQL